MIRKLSTLALAAAFAFSAVSATGSTQAHAASRNAKLAAGVVLGLAAVAALASAAQSTTTAYSSGYAPPSTSRSFYARCAMWNQQCSQGSSSSCIKYETRGCIE